MLLLLSPAKLLNTSPVPSDIHITQPRFLKQTHILRKAAQTLSATQWRQLTGISTQLAKQSQTHFASMQIQENAPTAKQAILAFNGDVYRGLQAASFSPDDLIWAQNHIRILSGLYGLLRPMDAIEPYRLEMGTRLKTTEHHTLYDFWGDTLLQSLLKETQSRPIINLASNEYIKALKPKGSIPPHMINCVFLEIKDGYARPLFMYTKYARGLLCRFAVMERLQLPEELKNFQEQGYHFNKNASSQSRFVFSRPQPAPKYKKFKTRLPVSADR